VRRIAIFVVAIALPAMVVSVRGADEPAKGVTVTAVNFEGLDKAVDEKKGKVVLIDFWATWCGPCVKKFPHFVATNKKYSEKGLVCMSVSMDPRGKEDKYDKDEVLKFLKDKEATFPNYVALGYAKDDEKFTKRFGLEGGIPFMVMFDKTGKRVWTSEDWDGKDYTPEQFNAELDKLIEAELKK
jgi:thiol-disulfide isomerase/thioredoxin